MVVIRLERRGTKKKPHHRIVVTVQTRPQGGRVLETLGIYDPSYEPAKFSVDESRVAYWVSSGAQVSDKLQKIMKHFRKAAVATTKG